MARCQSTLLLEAIEAPLDHVAAGIDGFVEAERPSWPNGALRTLVASLWNGVRDLSLPQPAATAWVPVAVVGDETVRAGAWSPAACGAWDSDALQDCLELRDTSATARSAQADPATARRTQLPHDPIDHRAVILPLPTTLPTPRQEGSTLDHA